MELQADISARRLATPRRTNHDRAGGRNRRGRRGMPAATPTRRKSTAWCLSPTAMACKVGDWVTVRIVESDEYDLWGERLEA